MDTFDLPTPSGGPLVIVGGAEDKTEECVVLRELLRLAGGASARIAVLTLASQFPHEVGATYVDVLTRLGAGQVEAVHIRQPHEANLLETHRAVETASAVFFTGGIQSRITGLIKATHLETLLHRRWQAGLVVGGTSAGAAVMSEVMIVGSPGPPGVRTASVTLRSGLGFAPHLIVDQHFSQRRRLGRLLTAVAQHPDLLGLGIDEDTAVVLRGQACEVIGSGSITVVDGRGRRAPDARHLAVGDSALTVDGTLMTLTSGDRLRLPMPSLRVGRGGVSGLALGTRAAAPRQAGVQTG
jgi:cyanophycinase